MVASYSAVRIGVMNDAFGQVSPGNLRAMETLPWGSVRAQSTECPLCPRLCHGPRRKGSYSAGCASFVQEFFSLLCLGQAPLWRITCAVSPYKLPICFLQRLCPFTSPRGPNHRSWLYGVLTPRRERWWAISAGKRRGLLALSFYR